MNNSSSCNAYSPVGSAIIAVPYGIALVVCLLAMVLVCALKLYRKPVYRLALYQVVAASAYAALILLEPLIFLNNDMVDDPDTFKPLCKTAATLDLYIAWTKVLLALCVTIHLFCFVVFHKNLKKFEVVYIAVSLGIPGMIIIAPHATQTFGLSGSWCWIQGWKDNCPEDPLLVGAIEQYVLWFGSTTLILVVEMAAMITMVIILYRRSQGRSLVADNGKGASVGFTCVGDEDQIRKALRQVFPLAVYPVLFSVFSVLPFAYRVYDGPASVGLTVASGSSPAGWSLSVGITLIVHISLAMRGKRRRAKLRQLRNVENERRHGHSDGRKRHIGAQRNQLSCTGCELFYE